MWDGVDTGFNQRTPRQTPPCNLPRLRRRSGLTSDGVPSGAARHSSPVAVRLPLRLSAARPLARRRTTWRAASARRRCGGWRRTPASASPPRSSRRCGGRRTQRASPAVLVLGRGPGRVARRSARTLPRAKRTLTCNCLGFAAGRWMGECSPQPPVRFPYWSVPRAR